MRHELFRYAICVSVAACLSIACQTSTELTSSAPLDGDRVTLVAAGSTWRYLDNGSNQASAWRAPAFDDSSWRSGPAELGYGDGDESTVVSYGPDSRHKYVTTYFRLAFDVADPASLSSLTLSVARDDGAVVYLDGAEVWRSNMPSGDISYTTRASSANDDGDTWWTAPLSSGSLASGTNVLAVEIHQTSRNSSDISFDLSLTGVRTSPAPDSGSPGSDAGTDAGVDAGTDAGGGGGGTYDPLPPIAPSPYALPSLVTRVTTAAELRTAVANGTAENVVLADGTYDVGCLQLAAADKLYAEHLGAATLTGGLQAGSNSSGTVEIHGLRIDIASSANTCSGIAIDNWGNRVLEVYDTWISGHRSSGTSSIGTGIRPLAYRGFVARRLVLRTFNDHAIRLWANDAVAYADRATRPKAEAITDIDAADVHYAVPGSNSGRTESAIWIGEQVTQPIGRLRVADSFIGIETVNNAYDLTMTDFAIDQPTAYGPSAAFYLEHKTEHCVFTRYRMTHTRRGFNAEWYAGHPTAASHFVTMDGGTIDATGAYGTSSVGAFLDEGTEQVSITHTTFIGQTSAGIVMQRVLSEGDVTTGNDFSRLAPGAIPIRRIY